MIFLDDSVAFTRIHLAPRDIVQIVMSDQVITRTIPQIFFREIEIVDA